MSRLHVESVDIKTLQRDGREEERVALARRIFALWQPLFSHLADKDYTFHLHKHVEDSTAVFLRAHFAVREAGDDGGLVIVRVHEHDVAGRRVARITFNAGSHPDTPASALLAPRALRDLVRYRALHPRQPFFLVDAISSARAYEALYEIFPGLRPAPGLPIPESLWPIAEAVADAMEAPPLPGRPREVREFSCEVAASADKGRRAPPLGPARERAAWYEQQTARPDRGLLVIAPLDWSNVAEVGVRVALRGTRAQLPERWRTWIPRRS
jgi:hypothetical protein